MRKLIYISAGFAVALSPAIALAQSATGITKMQARYDAEAAGYSQVSHLKSDGQGGWMGAGNKGAFDVMSNGKVVAK